MFLPHGIRIRRGSGTLTKIGQCNRSCSSQLDPPQAADRSHSDFGRFLTAVISSAVVGPNQHLSDTSSGSLAACSGLRTLCREAAPGIDHRSSHFFRSLYTKKPEAAVAPTVAKVASPTSEIKEVKSDSVDHEDLPTPVHPMTRGHSGRDLLLDELAEVCDWVVSVITKLVGSPDAHVDLEEFESFEGADIDMDECGCILAEWMKGLSEEAANHRHDFRKMIGSLRHW